MNPAPGLVPPNFRSQVKELIYLPFFFRKLNMLSIYHQATVKQVLITKQKSQHNGLKCDQWCLQFLRRRPFSKGRRPMNSDLQVSFCPLRNVSDKILRQTYITIAHHHFLTTCNFSTCVVLLRFT